MSDRNKILLPILVVAIGLVMVTVLIASKPEVEKAAPEITPPTVRVLTVQPKTVPITIRSQGTVKPRTEAGLVAEVSGKIVRVSSNFESGGFTNLGQPLVWIDGRDYEATLAAQKASLAQARVLLERERAEAEIARREWESLGRDGEPNPLVLRQPQLQEAQARVDAAEAAVQRAELDLERTVVRAPFTGRIRSTSVDRGGFVNRGTPIATLYSVDLVEVRLPVKDSELAFLDEFVGESASIDAKRQPSVDLTSNYAGERRTWSGRIVRSEGEIDPQTRMVHLVARVEDPYGLKTPVSAPLGVGLFVEAAIEGRSVANAYEVPRSALRQDGMLMVVDDNRLRMRAVNILRTTADSLIVNSGLSPGDQVVVSKLDVATDGMVVDPMPAELESFGSGFREVATEIALDSESALSNGATESDSASALSVNEGPVDEGPVENGSVDEDADENGGPR